MARARVGDTERVDRSSPSRMRAPVVLVIGVLVAACTAVATTGGALASGSSPAATAVGAFVRVNQVGYPSADSKRAYLLASVPETGATFVLSNGSTEVFGGSDRRRSRPVERRVPARVRPRLRRGHDPGYLHDRGDRPARRRLPAVPDRRRLRGRRRCDRERAVLLPERARRGRVAGVAAADPGGSPARSQRDDLRDAPLRRRQRRVPGVVARARHADPTPRAAGGTPATT